MGFGEGVFLNNLPILCNWDCALLPKMINNDKLHNQECVCRFITLSSDMV